ncbi:hypothetical protein vBRpoSV10_107 [Ruegeria phage vB_RpoS-V10]|nr:hypothetical protein DSS3P8_106 [Roseobacter phage DSS3P8]AWY09229.1 hypothetical protein vBRpoSV10_107 [Ruegeria phage vB_RpoS-V10]
MNMFTTKDTTFAMMVGLPGSGKSTYAMAVLEQNPEMVYISTDALVQERADALGLTYDDVWPDYIAEATKLCNEAFAAARKAGAPILWDQTNLGVKKRRGLLSQVPKSYTTVALYFEVDEELRQQRIANRPGKTIPEHIDRSMVASYVRPSHEEGFDMLVDVVGVMNYLVPA